MDEFQLLLDLVVAVVAATVAWTVVSLFRAAVRALTPGCSQGALAPRHGLSWTLRGRFQSQGLSPLLWIVFVPGLLLGVTCSASSAPALPPAASAGRRKRESPTSLLLDRTGECWSFSQSQRLSHFIVITVYMSSLWIRSVGGTPVHVPHNCVRDRTAYRTRRMPFDMSRSKRKHEGDKIVSCFFCP